MNRITVCEFDKVGTARPESAETGAVRAVPDNVYRWLEKQCLELSDREEATWLRLTQHGGRSAVQVTSFVGVVRAPDGYQIEVLPKVGKAISGGDIEARQLLIDMLRCLPDFRHVKTGNAKLLATRMPLLEAFIAEFLREVERVVKHGLRNDYFSWQDNLLSLRGKLLVEPHLRQNMFRVDRFFTEHDEFSANRPENRILHTALRRVLLQSASQANHRLARELAFVFEGVPISQAPSVDFQRIRPDRTMSHYGGALGWARLILADVSPLTGTGRHCAPSLLFPMEALFEAFVAKHLARQIVRPLIVKTQTYSHHLVIHRGKNWFRIRPDVLIRDADHNRLVLDTKWKLLDGLMSNRTHKYGLSQSDLYQLHAYGLSYLDGNGDVALVYPRTDDFNRPLPVFQFSKTEDLRLWVLPFCLRSKLLHIPPDSAFSEMFKNETDLSPPTSPPTKLDSGRSEVHSRGLES